jgi:hypothetical protein
MLRDQILAVALVVAFATLVTIHTTLVAGLSAQTPRWRALVALLAVPLAPYWGMKSGMRARAAAWIAAAVAYAVLLWLAR